MSSTISHLVPVLSVPASFIELSSHTVFTSVSFNFDISAHLIKKNQSLCYLVSCVLLGVSSHLIELSNHTLCVHSSASSNYGTTLAEKPMLFSFMCIKCSFPSQLTSHCIIQCMYMRIF